MVKGSISCWRLGFWGAGLIVVCFGLGVAAFGLGVQSADSVSPAPAWRR